jgi:hypothetical protein
MLVSRDRTNPVAAVQLVLVVQLCRLLVLLLLVLLLGAV